MNILVACEESQEVCKAFREKGHNAYSCDIEPCSGGHPEWHILGDCLPYINNGSVHYFTTQNGEEKSVEKWDMLIAFPPCTHLALSGARWYSAKRKDGRQRDGIEFFCKFLASNVEKVSIENPRGIMSGGDYLYIWYKDICKQYNVPRKETQAIQPYEFGHPVSKQTCLWLKNLPCLKPTNIVNPNKSDEYGFTIGGALRYATDDNGKILSWKDPLTAKIRSKTFPGVAKAMAEQWSNL